MEKEKVTILGASRGLGVAFIEALSLQGGNIELLLFSRKEDLLQKIKEDYAQNFQQINFVKSDFSNPLDQDIVIEQLKQYQPSRVFYFAGGGPYGKFHEKKWRDHMWALEVSFLFPAKLLHELYNTGTKQFVFIGSAIAESSPDPMAASYAAGKHALKGLISSIQEEDSSLDLRLFSPGYMDTDMLPVNAAPRKEEGQVLDPRDVAKTLLLDVFK